MIEVTLKASGNRFLVDLEVVAAIVEEEDGTLMFIPGFGTFRVCESVEDLGVCEPKEPVH